MQFEPDKLRESVQRLLAYQPECMYLTHYSRVRDVQRLGASLLEQLARLVAIGRGLKNAPDRHEALKRALLAEYVAITAAHGCRFSEAELTRLLGVDLELNAQGMGVWLDKGSLNVSAVNFGLTGRAAIVTGAAQDISAACARRFAADGMALALWDVDAARGEALAAELPARAPTRCSCAATWRTRPRSRRRSPAR